MGAFARLLSWGGFARYNGRVKLARQGMAAKPDQDMRGSAGYGDPLGVAPGAAAERALMVETQVRPNNVNDRRVIEAMRVLPREAYVPAGALAYTDADIPLGGGRVMLAPMLIARLAQMVMMDNPAHVLVVGAGSGYGAALLATCGAEVVALEEEQRLAAVPGVPAVAGMRRVLGRLVLGWPAGGPYDAILIEGAVPEIPPAFAAQLRPGGRVIAILTDDARSGPSVPGAPPGLGRAVIAEAVRGEAGKTGFAAARLFDCAARPLPAFQPAPAFSF